MNIKKTAFTIASVALITLTSCSWNSISREQATQILKDIETIRGGEIKLPDSPISVLYQKAYYENGASEKIQEEFSSYITAYRIPNPAIYIKQRNGVGENTISYTEEYHYIKNNIYISKIRTDEKSLTWKCVETDKDVNSTFFSVHASKINLISTLISSCDKPVFFADYISSFNSNETSNLVVEDKYTSINAGMITAEIYVYKHLLDNKKDLYYKLTFDYLDNLLNHLTFENYLDVDRTSVSIKIDYASYANISSDGLICEEIMEEPNPEVQP